jgi:hypothetical protein
MTPTFNYLAAFYDHYQVRILDCTQSMGDDEDGTVFNDAVDCLLHDFLGLSIERTGCLV